MSAAIPRAPGESLGFSRTGVTAGTMATRHRGRGRMRAASVADGQYHQARIAWLQAIAQRLQDTVALYAALGGGLIADS